MRARSFRAASLPQFSAGASAVRRHRRESGNGEATRTQWPTQKGAGSAAGAERRARREAAAGSLDREREAAGLDASTGLRALTPPGTPPRLAAKNLLKTGAWTSLRVRANDHGSRRAGMAAGAAASRRRHGVPPNTDRGGFPAASSVILETREAPCSRFDRHRGMSLAKSGGCPAPAFGAREESQR